MNRPLQPNPDLADCKCPSCGYKMDYATCTEKGEEHTPAPGDVSICVKCCAFLRYGDDMQMEPLDVLALRAENPVVAEQLDNLLVAIVQVNNKAFPARSEYEKRCDRMFENAKNWRATNPGREVLIQYNYPPEVCIIQSISQAIKLKVVTANDAGLDLIKSLGPWECAEEPTVNMVRVVLEHEGK